MHNVYVVRIGLKFADMRIRLLLYPSDRFSALQNARMSLER